MDEWVIDGLPIDGQWQDTSGCKPPGGVTSTVDNVTITGAPGGVTSVENSEKLWALILNDGTPQADFRIDRFNGGALVDSPMTIVRATGVVSFNDPVYLAGDPVDPLEAATKQYADNNPNYVKEAPIDNTTYGRDNGTWVPLPGSYMPEAPNTSQRYGRFNSIWQLDAIQTDAPSDGAAYARSNGAWTAAVTGGPYMPISGGAFTGVVAFPSNNSVVINGALNTAHAILGQVAGLNRWQLQMPDQTTEGVGNVGANFSLSAFSTTGGFLGTWLTIARADGAATFNGAGVTVSGGLAVNGTLAMAGPGQFALGGGTAGQVLATNGSGVLSWATRLADAPSDGQFYTRQNAAWAIAPGGMTDAPNDGTAYARKSAAWAHLTHTDITDWTATLAPYALTTAVPVASSTTPTMNGTAAVGTGTTWARADHVHPSDTSRYAASNPSGYQTAAQVTAALPVASSTTPLMDGTAAVGTGTTWARADHVHPTSAINDNRIINGNFAVNQRGQVSGTALAAAAYGHDRWKAGAAGCTYTFTAALPDTTVTITAGTLTQIIEGGVIEGGVYTLSWTGTAQARVYQGTPSGAYAASPVVTASLPAGVNTIVEFNTGTVVRVKLEIGVATPYPRQSLAKSLADCQRYYQKLGGGLNIGVQGYAGVATPFASTVTFQVMRAAPTATVIGNWTSGNTGTVNLYPGAQSLLMQLNPAVGGFQWFPTDATGFITLSAEL